MKCECGKDLGMGALLTKLGNEIEYMECQDCGLVEVCGLDIENQDANVLRGEE